MTPSALIRRPAQPARSAAANDADGGPLVPVESGVMDVATVRGRVLHGRLGVSKDFTSWAKAQVQRGRLVEGRDYLLTQQGEQRASGTKRVSEYHFTVEAAKHIAMMSGTDKGFEVRDYFIECERRASAPANVPVFALPDFTNPADAARAWADQFDARTQAELRVAVMVPQVAALHRIA